MGVKDKKSRRPRSLVERQVDAGVPLNLAVISALAEQGTTLARFADEYGVQKTSVSGLLNGSTPFPYERERDALCDALGVTRKWLDDQLKAVRDARLVARAG